MYQIQVSNIELNVDNHTHLLLLDFMLKESLSKLDSVQILMYEHSTDRIYLYLILNPSNTWLLQCYPQMLDTHITKWFNHCTVTELTVDNIKSLLKCKEKRHELLRLLLLKATPAFTYDNVNRKYQANFN